MNLLDIISKPIQSVREALDLEPPSLTTQLAEIKNQLMKVQKRLDESRAISREKDALIAELREAMAVQGDMVLEESAYYLTKDGQIVDGPFCSCCADRDRKNIHLVSAAKPKGQTGRLMDWVQCPQCQVPFRSKQAGERLKAHGAPAKPTSEKRGRTSSKASSKPKPATRTAKKETPALTEAATESKPTAQTRTTGKVTASKTKPNQSSR